MSNNNQEKLSISDWISFLSAEKHSNVNNTFSIAAFVIAALALIVAASQGSIINIICVIFGADGLLYIYYKLSNMFGRRATKAEKLLDDIMLRNERDLSKIESEWKEFLAKAEKKKAKSTDKATQSDSA